MPLIAKNQLDEHRPRVSATEMELVFNTCIREALVNGWTEVEVPTKRLAFQITMAMDMLHAAGYKPKMSTPPGPQSIQFSLE